MLYYVLLTGQGGGCDYTIGCNKNFQRLRAKNMEEAKKEVSELCDEYGEPSIAIAEILEVCQVEVITP